MNVIVVESPNKVRKIQGYLDELYGNGKWRVVATVGHWRGLPPMQGQAFSDVVDTTLWIEKHQVHAPDVARRLGAELARARGIYLATDPDREGEAIAWHVLEEFRIQGAKRVLFTEITKRALKEAIERAGDLDVKLVDAQRARQVLDYEIGMEVSRRLWRFGAKSAGRVQSAALRIVVEREQAIASFVAQPFFTVGARYREGFTASVATFAMPDADELDDTGETDATPRLRPKRFRTRDEADVYIAEGRRSRHIVDQVEAKPTTRKPRPPFTTPSLQAEASTRFGWDAQRTSKVAQTLFERGLITYIRTDSVALSAEAIEDIRGYLAAEHPEALPPAPPRYADKAAAQGAHEAIRPTSMRNPDADTLAGDELELYRLIWKRTLLCQAKPAELTKTVVSVRPEGCSWRLLVTGSVVDDPGWLALDDSAAAKASDADEAEAMLPPLTVGQVLNLEQMTLKEQKTKAPSRFTEASLIRYLERKGIGRPSTYAAILSTLTERGYVAKKKRFLVPEPLGTLAEELTRGALGDITHEGFTAATEKRLDDIAEGSLSRASFLSEFHNHLTGLLEQADAYLAYYAQRHPELDRDRLRAHDEPCPRCQASMIVRQGKYGPYAQCSAESCRHRLSLEPLKAVAAPCPECAQSVVEQPYTKDGKRKVFFRCTACEWKSSFPPPALSPWPCHADAGHGAMVEHEYQKDGKKRRFYACRTCGLKAWTGQKPPSCPACAVEMRQRHGTNGPFWGCPNYPKCPETLPVKAAPGSKPRATRRSSKSRAAKGASNA